MENFLNTKWFELQFEDDKLQTDPRVFHQLSVQLKAQLLSIATRCEQARAALETAVARTAWASASNMHRGYYYPSPVHDLVIGSSSRGKLRRTIPPDMFNGFAYDFDNENRLVKASAIFKGNPYRTEYLFHFDDRVIGCTFEKWKSKYYFVAITEELYRNGRIAQLLLCKLNPARMITIGDDNPLCEMEMERFWYQDNIISHHDFYRYNNIFMINRLDAERSRFVVENGYISRFFVDEMIVNGHYRAITDLAHVDVSKKRRRANIGKIEAGWESYDNKQDRG